MNTISQQATRRGSERRTDRMASRRVATDEKIDIPHGYVNYLDAAKEVGVSTNAIRRYIYQGAPCLKGNFRKEKAGSGRGPAVVMKPADVIKWINQNKEYRARLAESRDARRRNNRRAAKAETTIENLAAADEVIAYIKTEPQLKCYWCKKITPKRSRHVDHIIPLSRGGAHAPHNLACSCRSCNLSKNAKMPEVFAGQYELALWSGGSTLADALEGMVDTTWITRKYKVTESSVRGRRSRGLLKFTKIRRAYYYLPEDVEKCYAITPPVRIDKKLAAKRRREREKRSQELKAKKEQRARKPKRIKYTKADLVWPTIGNVLFVPAYRKGQIYWCSVNAQRSDEMLGNSWHLRKHHSGLQLKRSTPNGGSVIPRKPYAIPMGAGIA